MIFAINGRDCTSLSATWTRERERGELSASIVLGNDVNAGDAT